MIDHFLNTHYEQYGMGPKGYNCWGLVVAARVMIFGREELPLHKNIKEDDKLSMTHAAISVKNEGGFEECKAHPAAIATAWVGRICVHVGLVVEADNRLWVLETNIGKGPSLTPIKNFESRYKTVIYYDNQ